MLGLKTQESVKFEAFWNQVQEKANEKECVFFLECGEGREFETDTMEGEDLRGWLIPKEQVEKFQKEWNEDQVSDDWMENIFWAEWTKINEKVLVEFTTY